MDLLNFAFEEKLERAETLPARCYTDAAYLPLEARRIFNRTWQLVGRLDQVKEHGSYFTADVVDEPIVIVRGQDGVVRANIHTYSAPGALLTRMVAPFITLPYQQYCTNRALQRMSETFLAANR